MSTRLKVRIDFVQNVRCIVLWRPDFPADRRHFHLACREGLHEIVRIRLGRQPALVVFSVQDNWHSVVDTRHHLVWRACDDREVANLSASGWVAPRVPNACEGKGTVIGHCDCVQLLVLSRSEDVFPFEEAIDRHQTTLRTVGSLHHPLGHHPGGRQGAAQMMQILADELRMTMDLSGCRTMSDIAGHDAGAENWATIASLIETCKLNAVDPQAYLTSTLTAIVNGHKQNRVDELLPWNYRARPVVPSTQVRRLRSKLRIR